jgi:hypothetical protein
LAPRLAERKVTMAHAVHPSFHVHHVGTEVEAHAPAHRAYQILHWGYTALPLIAGADKFFFRLANWEQYFSTPYARLSPLGTLATMRAVGVVEIVAGLIVLLKPRIGAYVVAAWLLGIIVNLVLAGGFLDVALRDFGLFLGALALGRLSETFDRGHHHEPGTPSARPA